MKRWLAGGAAVALALAFLAGRYTADPPVTTRTVTVQEAKRWVSVVEGVNTWSVVRTSSVTRERVVTRWLRPDGTPRKEQVRDTGTDAHASAETGSRTDRKTTDVSSTKSTTTQERIVNLRPRFAVQALGGMDLRWRKHWGATASMRVAGPVTAGAWVLPTARAGGVSLGVTW